MKKFLKSLIYGQYGPSLTSIMAVASFLLFVFVTLYLVLKSQTWTHYETFAVATAGGGLGAQTAGKWINNRFANQSTTGGS